jgi:hypothetical protein
MDEQHLLERLFRAEDRLTDALIRLQDTQVAALVGGGAADSYDAYRYDDLISRYRAAKGEAEAARTAWERWCGEQDLAAEDPAAVLPPAPLAPTPRLHFARWLYTHGRISG